MIKKKIMKRPARAVKSVKKETQKEREINSQLTSIYSDGDGRIPNMREIKIKRHHPLVKVLVSIVALGGLLAAAAWAGFIILPEKKFSEDKISLGVSGPTTAAFGATTTYAISYKNEQSENIKNAVLTAQYPKGFVFSSSQPAAANAGHTEWNLNDIGSGDSGVITITGLTYGEPGEEQSWRAFFTYRPENMNSDLQKIALLNVTTDKSPLSLAITGPTKAVLGNNAEYVFQITNKNELWPSAKIELKPNLPANFYVVSSTPKLDKNNSWVVKNILPAASSTMTFKVAGRFTSSTEPFAAIKGALYVLAGASNQMYKFTEVSATTELINNDINFNLAINGSSSDFNAQPGEILNTTIYLKNLTKIDLKNVVIKLAIDAPSANRVSALNWTELEDGLDGDVSGQQLSDSVRRGEITWSKKHLPELAKLQPGQSITIDIRLPTKDGGSFNLAELKSWEIKNAVSITYTDSNNKTQALTANPIAIKLNSDLKLEVRDSAQENSAGKEEHKIIWMLTNSFHPLKNLTLTAEIYGDAALTGSSTPAGHLNYDRQTKKIIWTVDEMPLDVDVLALPFTVLLNQKNTTQKILVSKVHVQASDAVTGETLDFMGDEVGLNL